MSDDRAREPDDINDHESMEVVVVGHTAPLRYPTLDTVVGRQSAKTPETKRPPRGFGHPAEQELRRSATVPADAPARTMNALSDALEEIMIELGGGIHA